MLGFEVIQGLAAFIAGLYCGFELCRWRLLRECEDLRKRVTDLRKHAADLEKSHDEFRDKGLKILQDNTRLNDAMRDMYKSMADAHDRRYQHWRRVAETQLNENY